MVTVNVHPNYTLNVAVAIGTSFLGSWIVLIIGIEGWIIKM